MKSLETIYDFLFDKKKNICKTYINVNWNLLGKSRLEKMDRTRNTIEIKFSETSLFSKLRFYFFRGVVTMNYTSRITGKTHSFSTGHIRITRLQEAKQSNVVE